MALGSAVAFRIDAIDQLGSRITRCPRKRLQSKPALIASEALKHIPSSMPQRRTSAAAAPMSLDSFVFHSVLTSKR
ncbi:hypothetical protein XH97_02370 [Bradyrhizobium sp. CCBAU 53380]|nr:hypothetical protein [Bradyrhizobium sp. CCBAU 53380]